MSECVGCVCETVGWCATTPYDGVCDAWPVVTNLESGKPPGLESGASASE